MRTTSVRVQAKGQVTIPKQYREKLNLKTGDLVMFVDTEQGVLVKPATIITEDGLRVEVTAVVRSIRERFADYSAEEIEELVDEALRDTRGSKP